MGISELEGPCEKCGGRWFPVKVVECGGGPVVLCSNCREEAEDVDYWLEDR